ncbi:hypothetical protein [Paenibacillus oleatilyticus]|uniref:hypothetical protein n=1 Tax=Paenibacillus oleatilyticus TaxID=2594886 RepID=UPI001C1FFE51|nr:hypothetical protein [Paenibacillus oleatilyticus]MBU7319318.1 hypothetical protein [Paenibacillus oleatilyticus]
MFPINRKEIKRQTKLPGSKSDLANTNAVVFDQWKLEMWNIMDKAQQQSIFNLGHWIIFHDNLIELFRQMREQPGVSSALDEAAAALGITLPKS